MIVFDRQKCIQCGQCKESCAFGALTMVAGYPVISESCVGCNQCKDACPTGALQSQEIAPVVELEAYRDIWVIAETDPITNKVNKVTLELLSQGRLLADRLKQRLGVVLLTNAVPNGFSDMVGDVGCDFALVEENAAFGEYHTERFASEISALVAEYHPAILFMAASETGRDLAPRVSAKLKTGLTADCTGFDLDGDGNLIQIRPTYGGSIMASIVTPNHRPQMASVRPNVFPVVKAEKKREVEVTMLQPKAALEKLLMQIKSIRDNPSPYKNVAESEVVVVAGYGVGSKQNLAVIQRLTMELGAALGVTRKVVDEGWAPYELQIGQTGKTIAPELYIAFGVSGALQHTIGIRNAKNIIAVNNDPAAPIFSIAKTAIMGDCMKVAEELLKAIEGQRERR